MSARSQRNRLARKYPRPAKNVSALYEQIEASVYGPDKHESAEGWTAEYVDEQDPEQGVQIKDARGSVRMLMAVSTYDALKKLPASALPR